MTAVIRRYDLDWLRIIAFGLLIFYHIGMFYVTWDWHVKSPHASMAIEPLMILTSPWRLSLLFLISGVATAFLLDKTRRGFFRMRSQRLLIPLIFGIGILFFNGKSIAGWLLSFIGVVIIFTGVLMNLHIYFQPTSLFGTIVMIVLLAGGIGLIVRAIAPHARREAD